MHHHIRTLTITYDKGEAFRVFTNFANHKCTIGIFKPGAHHAVTGRHTPGFLKLLCPQIPVCMCGPAPKAINN